MAEFYLHHRLSEDFDFFTDKEIDQSAIRSELEPVFKKTNLSMVDYQETASIKIFFLKRGQRENLKVDFNYWAFERLEKGKMHHLLSVDSLLDIAVNKLHAVLTRKKARDFIDLYFILKDDHYNLELLLEKIKEKYDWPVDPLYLASRLLEAENVKDYPRMIKEFSKEEMVDFYLSLSKAQKEKIVF